MSSFFNIYFYLNFYLTQALDDSPAMNVPGVGNFENTGKSGRGKWKVRPWLAIRIIQFQNYKGL